MTKLAVAVRNFAQSDYVKATLARTNDFSREDVFAAPTSIAAVVSNAIRGT
jgi:hypothetical protein